MAQSQNASFNDVSPESILLDLVLSMSVLGATCSECMKAQYQLSIKAEDSDFQPISDVCGANFTGASRREPLATAHAY